MRYSALRCAPPLDTDTGNIALRSPPPSARSAEHRSASSSRMELGAAAGTRRAMLCAPVRGGVPGRSNVTLAGRVRTSGPEAGHTPVAYPHRRGVQRALFFGEYLPQDWSNGLGNIPECAR
jgi:hypothetical protein